VGDKPCPKSATLAKDEWVGDRPAHNDPSQERGEVPDTINHHQARTRGRRALMTLTLM
jgi:hypothetical protein